MAEEFAGKAFRIVSRRDKDGNVQCALIFKGTTQEHALELPGQYFPYSPFWYVSPDARWVLRRQKTGSGSNGAVLFEVHDRHRVVPHQPWVNELAWKEWERRAKPTCTDYFHDHWEFHRWELSQHRFSFEIGASHWPWCTKHAGKPKAPKGMSATCFYDLRTHRVRLLEVEKKQ